MINRDGIRRDVIVIAGSAGGIPAVIALLQQLDAIDALIGVVIHRSPVHGSELAELLGRNAKLPVREPRHGEPCRSGTVYLAPRDRHLTFDSGTMLVTSDVKEHRTRPAADPLFRSAAQLYGARVVGVVLSGGGSDGVSGALAIGERGGLVLVQDPREALHPSMPQRTIAHATVHGVLPVADLAKALSALASGQEYRSEVAGRSRT